MPIETRTLKITDDSPHSGGRIDRCVQSLVGGSRAHVTGLFDHDCVMLNRDQATNPGHTLAVGDRVEVRFEVGRRYSPRRRPEQKSHRGFRICYEDRELIVVDKSADLLTVPTEAGEPHTLQYRVNEHVRQEGRGRGAFVVHRLDRGVSGLLVFGKTRELARALQDQFRQRKPERRYDAVVAGHVSRNTGAFRSHLATGGNLNRYSTRPGGDTELAITHYEVVRRRTDPSGAVMTHVNVRLETGRRNQIRVQFAEAGHSVIGDRRYRPELWQAIHWPHKRLALHASTLGFAQPVTGQALQFVSELPAEIRRLLRGS
jgi:23S rRNA pseudouridine1911/1915/1917 synthase